MTQKLELNWMVVPPRKSRDWQLKSEPLDFRRTRILRVTDLLFASFCREGWSYNKLLYLIVYLRQKNKEFCHYFN